MEISICRIAVFRRDSLVILEFHILNFPPSFRRYETRFH